jgi:sec-independent protein translocase protein TatA
MIGGLGVWELLIILGILLLVFGPSRLGDLGSSLGKGIKGFRKSIKDDEIDVTPEKDTSKEIQDTDLDKSETTSKNKEEVQ